MSRHLFTLFQGGCLAATLIFPFSLHAAPAPITIRATPVVEWFTMDARIEPVDQGSVAAQTAGRVSRIAVDVNDVVPSGALLVEITNTTQSAGVDQAHAALISAQARARDAERQLARMSALVVKGTVSRREYDAAKTEADAANSAVDQAKAAEVQARENLGYTRITAPYAGIVSARHVSVGETVAPGQLLLSGYAFEQMRLVANLPARLVDTLKPETRLKATLPDGATLMLTGHQLFQFSDPASHTFTLRVALPHQDSPRWHAGSWAQVALPLPATPTLMVPEQAVLRQSELSALYVHNQSGYQLRQVRLGRHQDGQVEIIAGLKDGEQIAPDAYAVVREQGGHYAP